MEAKIGEIHYPRIEYFTGDVVSGIVILLGSPFLLWAIFFLNGETLPRIAASLVVFLLMAIGFLLLCRGLAGRKVMKANERFIRADFARPTNAVIELRREKPGRRRFIEISIFLKDDSNSRAEAVPMKSLVLARTPGIFEREAVDFLRRKIGIESVSLVLWGFYSPGSRSAFLIAHEGQAAWLWPGPAPMFPRWIRRQLLSR